MIIKDKKHCKKKYQRGAVLLIAVTVASLVLAIGLGILNITTKEIILSSYSKESGKAFYAANTGIECALFWDISYAKGGLSQSPFATSTVTSLSETIFLSCAGAGQQFNPHGSLSGWGIDREVTSATTTFKFSTWSKDHDTFDIDNPCVEVKIEKYKDSDGVPRTKISSIGYNTCNTTQKRRVSRGVRVHY